MTRINLLSAGVQQNINIELYDHGSISVLENNCLSQADYGPAPSVGACKLDEDHAILVGGENSLLFFIHEISTASCQNKTSNCLLF